MTDVQLFIARVGPDGRVTEIPISESRIDIDTLISRSAEFRQRVATATGGKVVLPPHSDHANYIKWLNFVTEQLTSGATEANVGEPGDGCGAKTLFGVCNILFEYKCLLSQFEGLWEKVQPGSSPTSATGDPPPRRCWHDWQLGPNLATVASQLMTIFLVLGQKDAFKTELIATVWRSSELDRLETSVLDLVDLKAMRLEQLRVVFQALREHHTWLVGKDEVTARHIREQLEAKDLGRLTETWEKNCADNPSLVEKTPYCYMLEVEETLIPDLWANRDDASSCQNGERLVDDPRVLPHLDIPKLIGMARQKMMDLIKPAPPTKLEDDRETHIKEFLDAAEKAITKAQDQKVKELMNRRNCEVESWQQTLGAVSAEAIGTSDAP